MLNSTKFGLLLLQRYIYYFVLANFFYLFCILYVISTCTTLYLCHDGTMISFTHNCIHLEVPKAFAVSFSRFLTDTCYWV